MRKPKRNVDVASAEDCDLVARLPPAGTKSRAISLNPSLELSVKRSAEERRPRRQLVDPLPPPFNTIINYVTLKIL